MDLKDFLVVRCSFRDYVFEVFVFLMFICVWEENYDVNDVYIFGEVDKEEENVFEEFKCCCFFI